MSDKSDSRKPDRPVDIEEDIDSIPIVKLSLDEFDLKKETGKKGKRKSKARKQRLPSPPPPVYAPEEMPENAVDSASETETPKTGKRRSVGDYEKIRQRQDIFATEDNGLNTVDLSIPLGEDERFPQVQAYLSPEELRRREEARARAARKEKRLARKEVCQISEDNVDGRVKSII